jgi:hypothetical protein
MSKILLLCLFVSAPMSAIAADSVAVLSALEDPAPPVVDKRPEIAALLDKLKAHADKKGSEDRDAISVMDQLLPQYKTSGPKDKVAIVTTIAKCFELRRDDKEGTPNNQLFLACALCHGRHARSAGSPGPDLRESALALDKDAFLQVVKGGALLEKGMPRYDDMTREQVLQIWMYVRKAAREAKNSGMGQGG